MLAIVDYISDDNPDAAQRLKDDIESKAAKLAEHPRLYRPGRVEGTREQVVRANYILVYMGPLYCLHSARAARSAEVAAGRVESMVIETLSRCSWEQCCNCRARPIASPETRPKF
nr:type II toxin-antitoxin system RelE/ParE family toxin [Brenneria tiliae]